MEACTAVNNQQELNEAFENLIRNEDIRHEKDICSTFVQMNKAQHK
jgi:3-deoxy-D-manno-octulosonic-acid transferase